MDTAKVLQGLEPANVFRFFEEICNIPHASGNMKEISNYCVDFARVRGLNFIQDEHYNIIIFKDASEGYQDHPAVIIQGHLDMVAVKKENSLHDFNNDPLRLLVENGNICCEDTSLGGDDGIAVAYALALLDDKNAQHPPLEAVFTVDEEIGLLGAGWLDISCLKGNRLINIDSEDEGVFIAGCAGGATAEIAFPTDRINISGIKGCLTISNLKGGHSGMEIEKGYANAHMILGRLLYRLKSEGVYFGISSIKGGERDNVIPSYCKTSLVFPDDDSNIELASEIIAAVEEEISNEFSVTEPDLTIRFEKNGNESANGSMEYSILSRKAMEILTFFLVNAPNGVQYMNQSIQGLVETSLNMGILNTSDASVNIGFSVRSSVESAKQELMDKLTYMTEFLGGECRFKGEYPAWPYKKNSELREIFASTYKKIFKKDAVIETIHAGLECGIFAKKAEDAGRMFDIIAFGPDMSAIHSVDESLSIKSVEQTWNLLTEVLKQL